MKDLTNEIHGYIDAQGEDLINSSSIRDLIINHIDRSSENERFLFEGQVFDDGFDVIEYVIAGQEMCD